ncbi:MAG: hypothetical protein JWQ98_1286 [Chlorobi bacterium]|nr:hypothetical protein [Chlorobiota bacterium]
MMDRQTPPPRIRSRILLSLLVPGLAFIAVWYFMTASGRERSRLIEKGVHVPGRLIAVEETGTLINRSPQLLLTMEFRRLNGRLDTAQTKFVPGLRRIQYFQPGVEITVAYDTAEPKNATLFDFKNGTADASAGTIDSLRRANDSLKREIGKSK